jgi:hypothetical protein
MLKDKTIMQQAQLMKMKKNLEVPAPATSKLKGNDKQNPFLILDPDPDAFLAIANTVGVKLHQEADDLIPGINSSCQSNPTNSSNCVTFHGNIVTLLLLLLLMLLGLTLLVYILPSHLLIVLAVVLFFLPLKM